MKYSLFFIWIQIAITLFQKHDSLKNMVIQGKFGYKILKIFYGNNFFRDVRPKVTHSK